MFISHAILLVTQLVSVQRHVLITHNEKSLDSASCFKSNYGKSFPVKMGTLELGIRFIASTRTANVTLTCYDVIITSKFKVGQFSPYQPYRAHYLTSLGFILISNSPFSVIMIVTWGCLACILKTNKISVIFLFRRKSSTLNWDHVSESTQLLNHHLKIHFY